MFTHMGKNVAMSTLFTMSLQSTPGRPPVIRQEDESSDTLTVVVTVYAWTKLAM